MALKVCETYPFRIVVALLHSDVLEDLHHLVEEDVEELDAVRIGETLLTNEGHGNAYDLAGSL